jgi:hypothetical protein
MLLERELGHLLLGNGERTESYLWSRWNLHVPQIQNLRNDRMMFSCFSSPFVDEAFSWYVIIGEHRGEHILCQSNQTFGNLFRSIMRKRSQSCECVWYLDIGTTHEIS